MFGASIGIVLFALQHLDSSLLPSLPVPAASDPAASTVIDEPVSQQGEAPVEPPPVSATDAGPAASSSNEPAVLSAPAPKTAPASAPDVTVSFDNDTYVASESDGSIRLIVKRRGSLRGETSFRWTLKSNSAEAGADFAAIGPDRERMAPGVASVGLTIPLVSDAIAESTELFQVELTAVEGGAAIGQISRASVIIVDDD